MNKESKEKICCPKFDPEPWQDKTIIFDQKKFIKDHVWTFLFMPLNFGGVISRMMTKVDQNKGNVVDYMCLSDHTSKWNMDLYLAVDREIPGADNLTLSGVFYSRVYEGDFKETGKWCENFAQCVREKGEKIKKWYMWYTTCPKCAKKYGKNYVVVIAELEKKD